MSYVFNFYAGVPPPEGTNTAPPPSRPRAIRARSEENSPRRHHRHRRHNRHRSRSRHDPQRGEIQPPAVAPQLRAPVPSAAPPAVPPGYWHVAPDASPFRGSPPTFARHPPPRPRTPHRGEPPVRAKSAPAERSPPKSSRVLMYLREYGLLAAGRHKPHGLLVRPDRGDLNLLDQLCLVLVFFLSLKKAINRLHKLRGQGQAPPPHRRNRLKIRTPLPK